MVDGGRLGDMAAFGLRVEIDKKDVKEAREKNEVGEDYFDLGEGSLMSNVEW